MSTKKYLKLFYNHSPQLSDQILKIKNIKLVCSWTVSWSPHYSLFPLCRQLPTNAIQIIIIIFNIIAIELWDVNHISGNTPF